MMSIEHIKISAIPMVLLLVVIGLDKIFLVPPIEKFLISRNPGSIYRESDAAVKSKLQVPIQEKANGRKIALVLGSSMLIRLNQNAENIAPQTGKGLNWNIVNYAYIWSSMFTQFARYYQTINAGLLPDLVIIDFSPATFNTHTPAFMEEVKNAMPPSLALSRLHEVPASLQAHIYMSSLFISYRYRLRPTRLFHNHFILENAVADLQKDSPLLLAELRTLKHGGKLSGSKAIDATLQIVKSSFKNYRPDVNLESMAHALIQHAHRNHIRLFLIYPQVHPRAYRILSTGNTGREWEALLRRLPESSHVYRDYNRNFKLCNKYVDAIHLGSECYSKIWSDIRSSYKRDARSRDRM